MRSIRTAAVIVVAGLGVVVSAAPASADPEDDVVRELAVEIEIDADGLLHVTETYAWDFGDREGLGLRRHLEQRFAWPDEPELMRIYRYDDIAVHSPSGAPDDHWIVGDEAYLELEIGAPDDSEDTRTGVQTYELSYTIAGALNAIRDDPDVEDQDELFWNVTGSEWDNEIEHVTTTVTGPVEVIDALCWEGTSTSDSPCPAEVDGDTATFTAGPLDPGEEQTVAVAFPPDTFEDIEPILVPAEGDVVGLTVTQQRVAEVTDPVLDTVRSLWWLIVLLVAPLLAWGTVRRVRQGRDDHFVGLAPGTLPPEHERDRTPVARLEQEPPETVQFTPPQGLRPAEASWLLQKATSREPLATTLVDLAVRGFLTITEVSTDRRGTPDDWDLSLTPGAQERRGELAGYEDRLLADVFEEGSTVRLSALKKSFEEKSTEFGKQLARQVDAQGLFTRPMSTEGRRTAGMTRRAWSLVWQTTLAGALVVAILIGDGAGLLPPSANWLLAIPLMVLLAWLVLRGATFMTSIRRSATGRALYEQTRGFKRYLETAEANQIRFEEGIDVFSRYLPYAIAFGVAERWATIFAQLQEAGQVRVDAGWYVGSHPGAVPNVAGLGKAVSAFSTTAGTTLGSSGGSGFSGGGGAGGGGGGGGGGGR